MTTINNLSIEQMREILEGAPEGAKAYNTKMKQYTNGFIRCSSDVYFDDLRTAIAEQDSREFKVGDLVVHPKFDNKKIYEIIEIKGDLFTVFYDRNSHSFRSDLRHATPEEIKAGHRLEAEHHG